MSSIFDLSWILKSNSSISSISFPFSMKSSSCTFSFIDQRDSSEIKKWNSKQTKINIFFYFQTNPFKYILYILFIFQIYIYIDIVIYYINIVLQTKHTYILINIYKQLKYFKNIFSIYLKYICLQINIYWNKIQWTISNENLSMMEQ